MKLEEALKLGEECGLQSNAECINNVILHTANLFDYDTAEKEVQELLADAQAQGVKFCSLCGSAMIGENCYMSKFTHRDPM